MIEKSFEAELVDALVDAVPRNGTVGSRERHAAIAKRLGISKTSLYDLSSDSGKLRINLHTFVQLLWMSNKKKALEFFEWLSTIADGQETES